MSQPNHMNLFAGASTARKGRKRRGRSSDPSAAVAASSAGESGGVSEGVQLPLGGLTPAPDGSGVGGGPRDELGPRDTPPPAVNPRGEPLDSRDFGEGDVELPPPKPKPPRALPIASAPAPSPVGGLLGDLYSTVLGKGT